MNDYHAQIETAKLHLDGSEEKYQAFLELVESWLASESILPPNH